MNPQSKATATWQKKKGLVSKAYKLPQEVVDAFARACNEKGISQASQLVKYMKGYVKRAESKKKTMDAADET